MKKIYQEVKDVLQKPYHDLEFVLLALKEVLEENGEEAMAKQVPWIEEPVKVEDINVKTIQLYSLAFQLLNMVEVNSAVQSRRKKEDQDYSSNNGLWGSVFKKLLEQGVSKSDIADEIEKIRVEPVLTAHPTEAKRATVLEHHRTIYLQIVQLENSMYNRHEKDNQRNNIKQSLYKLWKTGEVYLEKPDVQDELNNVLYYLVNVFPEVLNIIDRRLKQAGKIYGLTLNNQFPKLRFGNWVGGDRDGHPKVTSEVTLQTLLKLRLNAFVVINRRLNKLIKELSMFLSFEDILPEAQARMMEMVEELGGKGKEAFNRNKDEAFRQFINLMKLSLPIETFRDHATQLLNFPGNYIHSHQLVSDLQLLQKCLVAYGARNIADNEVNMMIHLVKTFGFHLAVLDIRQNSAYHDKVMEELLIASNSSANNINNADDNTDNITDTQFSEWPEEKRLEFINRELTSARPFCHPNIINLTLGEHAKELIATYRTIDKHTKRYGLNCIGSFIVSMTRSVSDLLLVYLLGREAGLTTTEEGMVMKLPVVPLLETIDDLIKGPEILDQFLAHPFTKKSLEFKRQLHQEKDLIQQVMVGYSDSNKDGGIMASQWSLYQAQYELSKVGLKHGVKIVFFHGKGGSISRGAGPTHYFVNAFAPGSLQGRLRQTEQGETIAQKYANNANAAYNIELFLASTLQKTILDKQYPVDAKDPHPQAATITRLANEARKKYTSLIDTPGFFQFFRQATPIDVIEVSKIGSRPSKRTGASTLEDLRAIPWVFSWSQARFHMTSWYGVGSALEAVHNDDPSTYQTLKETLKDDPFLRNVFTNIDTSLAAADENIMARYAELVIDKGVRKKMLGNFVDELTLTRRHLMNLLEVGIEVRRRNHYYSNQLRASLMESLHLKQIDLIAKWRKNKESGHTDDNLIQELHLTVNALAGAMRNTG